MKRALHSHRETARRQARTASLAGLPSGLPPVVEPAVRGARSLLRRSAAAPEEGAQRAQAEAQHQQRAHLPDRDGTAAAPAAAAAVATLLGSEVREQRAPGPLHLVAVYLSQKVHGGVVAKAVASREQRRSIGEVEAAPTDGLGGC